MTLCPLSNHVKSPLHFIDKAHHFWFSVEQSGRWAQSVFTQILFTRDQKTRLLLRMMHQPKEGEDKHGEKIQMSFLLCAWIHQAINRTLNSVDDRVQIFQIIDFFKLQLYSKQGWVEDSLISQPDIHQLGLSSSKNKCSQMLLLCFGLLVNKKQAICRHQLTIFTILKHFLDKWLIVEHHKAETLTQTTFVIKYFLKLLNIFPLIMTAIWLTFPQVYSN